MLDKFLNLSTKQKTIYIVSAGLIMFVISFLIGYLIGEFYLND